MFNMMTKVCWDSERLNLFESGRNLFKSSTKIYYSWGGHHSFVVSSAPTIKAASGSNPKHTIYTFSNCIIEIVMKKDENKQEEAGIGPFLRITFYTSSKIFKN